MWWQPVLCGVNTSAAWSSNRFYVADNAVLKLSVLHIFCIYKYFCFSVRKEGKTEGRQLNSYYCDIQKVSWEIRPLKHKPLKCLAELCQQHEEKTGGCV